MGEANRRLKAGNTAPKGDKYKGKRGSRFIKWLSKGDFSFANMFY